MRVYLKGVLELLELWQILLNFESANDAKGSIEKS